jgi:hypothetical protein
VASGFSPKVAGAGLQTGPAEHPFDKETDVHQEVSMAMERVGGTCGVHGRDGVR